MSVFFFTPCCPGSSTIKSTDRAAFHKKIHRRLKPQVLALKCCRAGLLLTPTLGEILSKSNVLPLSLSPPLFGSWELKSHCCLWDFLPNTWHTFCKFSSWHSWCWWPSRQWQLSQLLAGYSDGKLIDLQSPWYTKCNSTSGFSIRVAHLKPVCLSNFLFPSMPTLDFSLFSVITCSCFSIWLHRRLPHLSPLMDSSPS